MRKLLLVALLVAGCSGATPAGDAPWTRNPAYTTCTQWLGQMTAGQRVTMATQLLPIFRLGVDTAAPARPDLVPAFVEAIGAACRGPHQGVAEDQWSVIAAGTLAFTQDKRFQP